MVMILIIALLYQYLKSRCDNDSYMDIDEESVSFYFKTTRITIITKQNRTEHNTTQHNITQHSITQYNTIQYDTIRYDTIQYDTI